MVELTALEIGRTSVKLGYEIRRQRDGALCFHADVTTVLVDLDGLRPKASEPELRAIFERFLSA